MPLSPLTLVAQPYFKHLKSFRIQTHQFEELRGEKLRAASQRARARDVYDLAKAADEALKGPRIRALAVIKCWNVGDAFDPQHFFGRLRSCKYDWEDLREVVRRSEKITPQRLILICGKRYGVLLALSEYEKSLIADAKRRRRKELPGILLKEAAR